jgi:hypothetical protein
MSKPMKRLLRWVPLGALVFTTACSTPTLDQRRTAATPAVEALQKGAFDDAAREAESRLAADGSNPYARLVRAIVRYKKTGHQLSLDVRTGIIGGVASGGFNHKYLRSAFEQAERELGDVEDDLASAWREPQISVELCLACWEIDWNGNGRVDSRDRLLMQIEQDAEGKPIPEDDPRRKPTFRLDRGDVAWARAFVSFQRAILDLVLAYDWAAVDAVLSARRGRDIPDTVTLKLAHPERIAGAKARLLEGLDRSEDSRVAYLAETDDDREWVPNPKQQSHPMPLPVDAALYETWGGVVGDLKGLVRGDEGLSVTEVAQLGDHVWENPPRGYLDIGRMLSRPKDIVLHVRDLERLERSKDMEGTLASILGDTYVASMKASPLPGRLRRMKSEIDRREEPLERKLRYLFWIN